MATSQNSSFPAQDAKNGSPGVAAGSAPESSGSLPAPKPGSRSRVKTQGPQGVPTAAKPAAGKSVTKPPAKPKAKGTARTKETAQVAAQSNGAAAAQDAVPTPVEGAAVGASSVGGPSLAEPSAGEPVQAAATPPGERLSDEERQRRIAERAYRKAQERGFRGDRHLDDWFEAEREHDQGS